MTTARARLIGLGIILAASCALTPRAGAQAGRFATESVVIGTGGYRLNFGILWTCDDSPGGTISAPGEVDLIDGNGNVAGKVVATANGSTPVITVSGSGAVSGVTLSINREGAGGTPADGLLHGTWSITGPAPGTYTLHLWFQQRMVSGNPLSAISTDTLDTGGGGTVVAPTPTPTPSPTPSPTPTPTRAPTPTPTSAPSPANQPGVVISPASATVQPGQSVVFAVSGGATGNYVWGGAASGSGSTQTVVFPAPGGFSVSVLDSGNGSFNPSSPATATIAVQAPFFTLSAMASGGGTVTGGGSYPPSSQATATAIAAIGNSFTGWTGDMTGATPSISILMNANKSVMAHFGAMLTQTIVFVRPGTLTTRSPAFALVATASSGLPVTLTLDSGPADLISNVVTPTGAAGDVTITASQNGNSQYLPAPPVVISFTIGLPPAGVILSDDSATTKKSDKVTPTTSYTSGTGH
jgi:hypothetical protein